MAPRTYYAAETQLAASSAPERPPRRWRPSPTTTRRRSIACARRWRWAGGQHDTAIRLANMSVDESGMGSREPTPPRQGARHPARRAAAEEHGRHRGDPREGHRQVREAGRRDLLAHSGDEPVRHADRHRHLRDQVQGRGDLLAASVEPQDDERGGAADARGAASAGRARGCAAVRRAARAFRSPTS